MIDKITIGGVTYSVSPTTSPQLGDKVVTVDGVIYVIGAPVVEVATSSSSGDIERAKVNGVEYDIRDAVILPRVDKLEQRVKQVTWTASSNLNDFVTEGVYEIKGERTMTSSFDNLPIDNRGGSHTISARLEVLDSSISATTNSDDKCITQKLTLSNRVGGDGNVYIRTGRGKTYDSITWEKWGTLQANINVGKVLSLNNFVDNGIYSGVWTDGSSFAQTFVMVVINDYAVAGDNKTIVQYKYAYDTLGGGGNPSYTTRSRYGGEWSEWEDVHDDDLAELKNELDSNLANEVTRAQQAEAEIYEHVGTLAADLVAEFRDDDNVIKSSAMRFDNFNFGADADKVTFYSHSLKNSHHGAELPAATTESAGVMSAEDKVMLCGVNSQINGINILVEPDVVKDKCYINSVSKKWQDLSSTAGTWDFATTIYPIEEGEEYRITCEKVRGIGVWFLSTNTPTSSSTYGVIADSNIPNNAQLSDYPIIASNYPYLAITYTYGYEPSVEKVDNSSIVKEISKVKQSVADIFDVLSKEEEAEILSYDIRNYGLFAKSILANTVITENGNCEVSTEYSTTNTIPLDWNYGIMINCAGYCYIAFYDENKNFIERKTSYRNIAEIPVSDFPANAKYVAFSYKTAGLGIDNKTPDVFTTQVKKYSFDNCGVFRSTIKKKRNTRPRIDIYTTDSEYVILSKLMDAFLTQDCDVHFEFGNYNFEGIYKDMYDVYGLGGNTISKELPLGGNCRYYLNNSTITGTYPADVTFSSGCKVFGNLNEPCGFELYDGTIIANNCGYCIHSESLGAVGFYKHYMENIKFIQNGGSRPLGCGAGNSTILEVDSCSFISDTGLHDIAMHGIASTTYNRPAHTEVIVRNCSIPNGVKCNTLSANETGVLIYINNQSNVTPALTDGWELQEQDSADKGRQLALRSLFIAAGATYNEETGYYSLNGVDDLSEDDIKVCYAYKEIVYNLDKGRLAQGLKSLRAIYPYRYPTLQDAYKNSGSLKGVHFFRETPIEVFRVTPPNTSFLDDTRTSFMLPCIILTGTFAGCKHLHTVYPMDLRVCTVLSTDAFSSCTALKELRAWGLKLNLSVSDSPLISKESILYIVKYALPTSAITITLHPDAYARLADDVDIVAALEAQPLVSLVSA